MTNSAGQNKGGLPTVQGRTREGANSVGQNEGG